MKINYLILLLISFLFNCTLERRILNPPNLEEENIDKKIVCYRPIRKNGPAMYLQTLEDKIIAHNYGHGGGGWSLAPGSAEYVINKLDARMKQLGMSKKEPIVVVGAGIIGLFSVFELIKKGYKNITIIAEDYNQLPSNHAGGLWSPFHIGDISKKKDKILTIGIKSYNFFLNIAKGKDKYFECCAKVMPAYFLKRNPDLELFVGTILKPAKQIIADFNNGFSKKMYVYDNTMIMNTPLIMSKLTDITIANNVKHIKRKIKSFSELKAKVIVNCTGYGAKQLCNDDNMVSMQGHLIVLKKQNPNNLNYLMTVPFEESYLDGHKIKRLYYLIPRHDPGTPETRIGVIGGTLVEGVEKGVDNSQEFNKVIQRARKFYVE
ncbi:MAG: FAD-dependent oxidoreductase [Bacteroidetes bacterium]|nr:FAD-dependent oxidoreductase [Bacteroidota bacterium]